MKAIRQVGRLAAGFDAQPSEKHQTGAEVLMNGDGSPADPSLANLDAFDNARQLVRLIQCTLCSRPLHIPVVTLPCGNSICRTCLPTPHQRLNISYPNTPERQQGIRCPLPECAIEHALGECSNDVCLSKVMETIRSVTLDWERDLRKLRMQIHEIVDTSMADSVSEKPPEQPRSRVSNGGKLLAVFEFAEEGFLPYHSDCAWQPVSGTEADFRASDQDLLSCMRESAHRELECRVCYNIMFDPVTTPCGHTFCRKCLARVLDHSVDCPMCRQALPIPLSLKDQPSNKRLVGLLNGLCREETLHREQVLQTEEGGTGDMDTPIFVCALAFPGMPTFLHIFEPRYRLMIRRAFESNQQFGMVMYNRAGWSQGVLGPSHFMQYGTMLTITHYRILPDGRSLIQTRGLYRFRVKSTGTLDGYTVGSVERVEDISVAEEEALEAEELRSAADPADTPLENESELSRSLPQDQATPNLNTMSTTELYESGIEFIRRMQAQSAPWLHHRILDAYGGPPEDPATFPYWFACIVPIVEEEKYFLLRTTSVRERLKIVVSWVRRIEHQRS